MDAVGYQAQAAAQEREEPAVVLNSLVDTVRRHRHARRAGSLRAGAIPARPDEQAKRGMLGLAVGELFEKGLRMGTGQCNVKRYNRYLRDLIIDGRATAELRRLA